VAASLKDRWLNAHMVDINGRSIFYANPHKKQKFCISFALQLDKLHGCLKEGKNLQSVVL
jgi:hypothetical protein